MTITRQNVCFICAGVWERVTVGIWIARVEQRDVAKIRICLGMKWSGAFAQSLPIVFRERNRLHWVAELGRALLYKDTHKLSNIFFFCIFWIFLFENQYKIFASYRRKSSAAYSKILVNCQFFSDKFLTYFQNHFFLFQTFWIVSSISLEFGPSEKLDNV